MRKAAVLAVVGATAIIALAWVSTQTRFDPFPITDAKPMNAEHRTHVSDDELIAHTEQNHADHENSDVLVMFGDLPPVEVSFWPLDGDIPPRPLRVAESYELLANKAEEGDPRAGFALYLVLEECRSAHRTEKDLDQAINDLYATRTLRRPGHEPMNVSDDDSLTDFELALRNDHYQCGGLSDEQLSSGLSKWLPLAAEAEFLPAMDHLSWNAFEAGDFDTAENYLQQSWLHGSALALGGLYEIYKNGANGSQPEPITAAAYLYLQYALLDAQHPDEEIGSVMRRNKARLAEKVNAELTMLLPTDADKAKSMGRTLLLENPKCCVDW